MNLKLLAGAALLATSMTSFAQDASGASTEPAQSKSRVEVRAELVMWQRAGLQHYTDESIDFGSAEHQRRIAMFDRLMSGPEYLAEVQRLRGGQPSRTAQTIDRSIDPS